MQERCRAAGVALRPHVKHHRSAWLAARQLQAGATGLAAATLAEAAGLLRAGLGGDVLLTSVTSPRAVERIVALSDLGDLAVVADDPGFVAALAAAARTARVTVRVVVDVDVGQRRAGVRSAGDAVALAQAIAAEPDTLVFAGVQAYAGHLQLADADAQRRGHADAGAVLATVVDALRDAGHPPALVTGAGTGTAPPARDAGVLTEVQPGSYALMDATYARTPAGAAFGHAVHLHTTVRSVLADGVVVDAGLRAVSTDSGPALVVDREATWAPAGDEHGVLRGEVADLRPGDVVRLIPSHTDTTIALHRRLWIGATPVELL